MRRQGGNQGFYAIAVDDIEQALGCPAWRLRALLSLGNSALADIQYGGKDGLAEFVFLTDALHVLCRKFSLWRKAKQVDLTHGHFVDCAYSRRSPAIACAVLRISLV